MLRVEVKVYDTCKYNADADIKKIATVEYEIESFKVVECTSYEEACNMGFDEPDECWEYLILTLTNGETATFRNSRVDMFKIQ